MTDDSGGWAGAVDARPARKRLLFAFCEANFPTAALRKALEFGRALEADVHILRVFPDIGLPRPVSIDVSLDCKASDARLVWGAVEKTWEWLSSAFEPNDGIAHLHVRSGEFHMQVSACARALQAAIIVVLGTQSSSGSVVTRICSTSRLPVLVVRPMMKNRVIVGATDLRDRRYPILTRAAELGALFHAKLVAVHNLEPISAVPCPGVPWRVTLLPKKPQLLPREQLLQRVTERLHASAATVVADDPDPVDAVVREAVERDADLVVVGFRRPSWLRGFPQNSFAARVVDRSEQSVFVQPFDVAAGALA